MASGKKKTKSLRAKKVSNPPARVPSTKPHKPVAGRGASDREAGKKRKQSPLPKKGVEQKSASPTSTQTRSKAASNKIQTRSDRTSKSRKGAFTVLRMMRKEEDLSLSEASRRQHMKPATVRRYVGSALRQDKPGGRFRATKGDRLRRDLQIPTAQGPMDIPVYGIKNARLISDYLNAVAAHSRPGRRANLDRFKGKTIKVDGKTVELLTDPDKLLPLLEAGVFSVDQLYAVMGRG